MTTLFAAASQTDVRGQIWAAGTTCAQRLFQPDLLLYYMIPYLHRTADHGKIEATKAPTADTLQENSEWKILPVGALVL